MDWYDFTTRVRLAWTGQGYSISTIRTYATALRWLSAWAKPRGVAPADVTTGHLLEVLGSNPTWSRSSRAIFRTGVRSAYRWGMVAGLVTSDPTAGMPAARRNPPRPRPTPEHVYLSALRAADDDERLMLRLAAESGLRRAEVAQVHPQRDLVEDAGGWSLWVHGKGSKDRLVPLPADLARELRLRGPGYLFPGNMDGHLAPHTVGVRVSRLLPDGLTMHGLRHRFASVAHSRVPDLLAVQQLLGHASVATTQMYVLVDPARRRQLVDAVAQVSPARAGRSTLGA